MRFAAITVFSALLALRASASTVLLSDTFDTYNAGTLNKNTASSPNAAPNGSGNPWWGLSGGNFDPSTIVGTTNGVTPHSGSKMVSGTATTDRFSINWQNIAYRYNSGNAFTGNLTMTFWFYDPNGATNGANFGATAGISYYSDNSPTADYPASQTLNNSTTIDRLSLGGAAFIRNTAGFPQTYNPTQYQARVIGSTLGYTTNGWINLPITRSIGWHEGEIVVGAPNPNGTDPISFYIDNLTTPLLTTTTSIGQGYNNIELATGTDFNGGASNVGGFFDDVTLTSTPEPASLILFPTIGILLLRRRRRGE